MSTPPDADETRVRHYLRDLGLSHTGTDTDWWDDLYATGDNDTHAPTKRTMPAKARIGRLPDWRRRETADMSPDSPDTTADSPDKEADTKDTTPADTPPTSTDTDPDTADTADDWADETDPDDPVVRDPHRPANPARTGARRASAAYLALAPRTRVLIYNGTAAGLGYGLGVVPLVKGWIAECGHDTGHISAALILGIAGAGLVAHFIDRRTRHWWPPLAWACRIPLASVLLALGLYAPGTI